MPDAWFYVLALLGLVVLLLCAKALLGLVSIRETQVGVVVKKFRLGGAGLPNGRIVALNGEPGIQADTLAPGLHFWYWPWVYRIDKVSVIVVPPGHLGLVNARDGDPIPVNRILCSAVPCDNFQDARKFLSAGGQRGRQSAMLTAGLYRINTALFEVKTDIPIRRIESNKIGVVTALDGAPMPAGQMAAPEVPGHNNFQDPEAFIHNGGSRGLQQQIILAGTWNINPWFAEVEEFDLTEVPIGHVGVVVSYVGSDEQSKDVSGAEFTHGNIVSAGGKGVWKDPLYPGKHPLNVKIMRVEIVPTTNIVLNWANTRSESHKLDERLCTIAVRSFDGFTFNLDVSQIINIGATKAPWVISRVGSVQNLVAQVLEPIVGNYFRNSAQAYTVLDFLSNRTERQKEAREHIAKAIQLYDVQSVDTLIGDITPPPELMKTLTDRKLAEEQRKTFVVQQTSETTRQELERQRALADKQREILNSEQDVRIAEMHANAVVKTATGESEAAAKRSEGQAAAVVKVGSAEADVVAMKGRREAEAISAIGNARAEAYQVGVKALGDTFGLLQIFTALADKNIRLTPDVLVSGSQGSGASEGLIAFLLRDLVARHATGAARDPAKPE
jgi:uncharacterized membrane protein YqiK